MASEAATLRTIQRHLAETPGWWGFKVHGSGLCRGGIPDIVGCYYGHLVAFEVKSPTGRVRPLQKHEIAKIRAAGGTAVVVRSWGEVRSTLEALPGVESRWRC